MRAAIVVALTLVCTPAAADRLFSPVRLVKDAEFCGDLKLLKGRESLRADGRSERLSDARTLDAFAPIDSPYRCGRLPAGTFLFLDRFTHDYKYVCLRRRPGSDCWYFKMDNVGEIFELAPGSTVTNWNKGVTCDRWQQAYAQSVSALERDRKVIFAGSPKNEGERFTQGMIKDTLNMLTGSPNAAAETRSQLCLFNFRSAQEMARRMIAAKHCPQIPLAREPQEYQANLAYVRENCIMKE